MASLDWKNGALICAVGSYIVLIETDYEAWEKKPVAILQEENLIVKKKLDFEEKLEFGAWEFFKAGSWGFNEGVRGRVYCGDNQVEQVVFHAKGEYFGSLAPKASKRNEQILVHHFLKSESSKPFQKSKGDMQKILFHPKKPFMFLVTHKNTYIYNLQSQVPF